MGGRRFCFPGGVERKMFATVLTGAMIAISFSAPPGPVAMETIRRGLRGMAHFIERLTHQFQHAPSQARNHLPRRAFNHHPSAIDES